MGRYARLLDDLNEKGPSLDYVVTTLLDDDASERNSVYCSSSASQTTEDGWEDMTPENAAKLAEHHRADTNLIIEAKETKKIRVARRLAQYWYKKILTHLMESTATELTVEPAPLDDVELTCMAVEFFSEKMGPAFKACIVVGKRGMRHVWITWSGSKEHDDRIEELKAKTDSFLQSQIGEDEASGSTSGGFRFHGYSFGKK